MRSYRFYFLNLQSASVGVEIIEADTDIEAVELAGAVFCERRAQFTGYEVWDCEGRILHDLSNTA